MTRRAHLLATKSEASLIIVPTIELINQIKVDLQGLMPLINVEAVHSGTVDGVTSNVLAQLKLGREGGRVLIITWSSFERLPYFPGRANWNVFVDEIPQVCMVFETNAPDTHMHLTNHVELEPQGPSYSRLHVKNSNALSKLASTSDTALSKELAPMARQVLSPNLTTYVNSASFNRLKHSNGLKLTIFCVLRSRIFADFKHVTFLGANFERSLLFSVWKRDGVAFVKNAELTEALRFQEHRNGTLMTIYYASAENWSKRFRDREDRKPLRLIAAAAGRLMNGEQFAWVANKDVPAALFEGYAAVQLPQVSHGLNRFSHIHHVVYLSARLPPPHHFKFLEWLGVAGEQVRCGVHHESVYQTVNRCSVRVPDSRSIKRIVVPDLASATYLHTLFPGSTVEKLDVDLDVIGYATRRGRTRKFADVTSRVQAFRSSRKEETARLAAMMMGEAGHFTADTEEVVPPWLDSNGQKTCNVNTIEEGFRNSVTGKSRGSVFDHMRATHPVAVVPEMNDDTFIAALKTSHKEKHLTKEDKYLICPAIFDPGFSETTSRGLDNVVYANGVWLDFDVGNLAHKELAAIFPGLRIAAFNSFSSTKAEPRYRVYIPTSRSMLAKEYTSIIDQIIQVVKDSGYPLAKRDEKRPGQKAHGIDMSKRHAASLFYLPCQPRDPKGKIWKEHKDASRMPLDVDSWLEHAIPVETSVFETEVTSSRSNSQDVARPPVDQARIDRAMERWTTHGTRAGNGDSELFILSQELKRANLPFDEAEILLLQAAQSANTPTDRRIQAQKIMKKLRKSWTI
ncbi:hypothetical protein [Methylobacterium sp. Leaf91]|uniref:hypothetical protein n=1 Tax=Methylobacterium sp. Leaf91 TaxID=1736247 RepID=UPI0012E7D924|nr:hypothetical protein [Methylobacterium sp. Leaf91]